MNLFYEPKKVLIIKLNRLGDTVAFLPTIKAIREGWPKSRLTFLTTEIGKVLVEGSKLIDEVWVTNIDEIKTFFGFLRWFKTIKKNRFDIAITSSDSSSFIALLFFLCSIPLRVGFTNPKLSFLFNRKITFSKDITHTELNLRIVEKFGFSTECKKQKIDISISGYDKCRILEVLKEYGIGRFDPYVVLHVGSNRSSRRWSIERFTGVIISLVEKYSMKILCVGGLEENRLVNLLLTHVKGNYIVDVSGKTNIKQLIYLISSAILFIGHSSGPLQIAYMVGTPSISLWGASSPIIWGPVWEMKKHVIMKDNSLSCLHCEQATCPKNSLECMKRISVGMVIKEIFKLLEKYPIKSSI